MNMTPKEIVAYLDEYVIGQDDAKKSIALALRNRYRRMQLDPAMQDEVMPKNILMIGSTGVGKTEIARRLAKMMGLPFIKVEASKYTEVGFVGRDVESMVRDLVLTSIALITDEQKERNLDKIDDYVVGKIVEKLLPPLPKVVSDAKKEEYAASKERMLGRVLAGDMDDKVIEIEIPKVSIEFNDTNLPPELAQVQESLGNMFGSINKKESKREVTVAEAKEILKQEANNNLLDQESIRKEAIARVQNGGIIFLDEIDKIAVSQQNSGRSDPSKEGVQRDLLPIVEGSTVNTKHGQVKTDHILFIAAGAFHVSKPSDLIPELQGRFPLRVELNPLDEETLYKILSQTKNSLLRQYEALLAVEDIALSFDDEAVRALAHLAQQANEKTEDIGARRLHTVIENVIEEISFNADEYAGQSLTITKELVHEKLDDLVEDEDTARYIL
jgi:ATP-dependent HslUV protease ATP-binding subunit HslU